MSRTKGGTRLRLALPWHGGRWGGNAVVTADTRNVSPNHYIAVVAHELGHAFALDPGHNGVQQAFNGLEIAWGRTTAEWGDRMRILDFEAALLDRRPIFRKMVIPEEPEPVIKNEDLGQSDNEEDKELGDPIFISPRRKLTTSWAKIKSR